MPMSVAAWSTKPAASARNWRCLDGARDFFEQGAGRRHGIDGQRGQECQRVEHLGAGLADGRPEFAAGPRDWRTAPLWGSGAAAASGARFLHDGRARTLEEAILWHGGEAEAARNRYARLPQPDRAALTRFLFTL